MFYIIGTIYALYTSEPLNMIQITSIWHVVILDSSWIRGALLKRVKNVWFPLSNQIVRQISVKVFITARTLYFEPFRSWNYKQRQANR